MVAATAAAALLAVVACEDVVVEPADVASVLVTPGTVELGVGGTAQLAAEPFDGAGQPLMGYRIAWTTDDDRVATVDADGRVTATGSGTTLVRAAAGAAEGTASLSVLDAPLLAVDHESVGFVAYAGGGAPPAVAVSVANGGGGDLAGLGVATTYDGVASGWLTASLAGDRAPTTLSLGAAPAGLEPGVYGATVQLSAPSAANSPLAIAVSFEVREGQATASPPAAPSGLSAAAAGTTIDLAWADNSDDETEFRVERRTGAGSFAQVATVGTDVTTYADDGLDAATTYGYRVRACNAAGCSAYSAEATASTDSPVIPTAPSGLTATTTGPGRIDLAWGDNSGDETAFRLERQAPGEEGFRELAVLAPNVTAYADEAVTPDGQYVYRVRACADDGCSDYSNTAASFTPPVAPDDLTAAALSGTEIELAWSDRSLTETRFELQRRVGSGGFGNRATLDPGTSVFTDTGLEPGTAYGYRLRACNSGGCSPFSAEAADTTPPPIPPTPTDVTAAYADGAILVAWSDLSPWEAEFRIERRAGSGDFEPLHTTGPDVTSYQDATVAADTEYRYRLRACNVSGCSEPSNEVKLDTPPTAPSNLSIVFAKSDRIKIRWVDTSEREDYFRVERAVEDGPMEFLVDRGRKAGTGDNVDYEDRAVEAGTTYSYQVFACNESGCSPASNVVTTTAEAN